MQCCINCDIDFGSIARARPPSGMTISTRLLPPFALRSAVRGV